MGTAEKLTYLNDTKQLLKENINNLGGNLTNEPFRQYASALEGIYESLPKVSGIGASLSLSPSLMGKIKLNEIQGNTLQQNTPTPSSPVPIQSVTGLQNVEICGKNLFNKNNIIEGKYIDGNGNIQSDANSFIGEYISIDNAKTYYISSSLGNTKRIVYYNASKTFISRELLATTGSTLTIPNNTAYVIISGMNQDLDTLQLEKGSTATSYEPYKGNTYEVNLGKNLLNVKDGSYSYGTTNTWVVQNHEVKMSVNDITYQGGNIKLTDGTTSRWADGVDNNIAPSGTYTLSVNKTGTITFGSEGFVAFYVKIYNDDGTASSGSTLVIRNNQNEYTQTFTVDSGKHLGEITIYSQYIQCQDVELKIQLEKGSTATSYSPYFTPIELNKIGDYKDSIKKSTGKNLFDIQTITESKYIDSEGNLANSGASNVSDYISVQSGETYKFSYDYVTLNNTTNRSYGCYDENKNFLSLVTYTTVNKEFSFTIPNNTYYIRITIDKNVYNLQFEKGTTKTSYEPYGKVWYITKNIGKVVLNGSESWETQWNGDNLRGWRTTIPNLKQTTSSSQSSYVISNNYETRTQDANFSTGNYGISNRFNQSQIIIKNNDILNQNDFITWLGTHNTQVNYILSTPTYTTITNTELINQLESLNNAKSENGTTNINVTSEDLSMILNVSILKGE